MARLSPTSCTHITGIDANVGGIDGLILSSERFSDSFDTGGVNRNRLAVPVFLIFDSVALQLSVHKL